MIIATIVAIAIALQRARIFMNSPEPILNFAKVVAED
jgi:hypothetical protein